MWLVNCASHDSIGLQDDIGMHGLTPALLPTSPLWFDPQYLRNNYNVQWFLTMEPVAFERSVPRKYQ